MTDEQLGRIYNANTDVFYDQSLEFGVESMDFDCFKKAISQYEQERKKFGVCGNCKKWGDCEYYNIDALPEEDDKGYFDIFGCNQFEATK